MINVYVNYPYKRPNFRTITEAIAYVSEGYIPSEPKFPALDEDIEKTVIYIAPGVYRERLVLERPYVTLIGANEDDTIIVYDSRATEIMPDGRIRGTFRIPTVRICAHDITVVNLTFRNDAGPRYIAAQALAAYIDGDRAFFRKCRFIGHTDTLFVAPAREEALETAVLEDTVPYPPNAICRQYYEEFLY
ncbi:MAG: hypothetical protein IJH94_04815 [Clostridia bacterium]|nr:hypothetical protein [Clostridia bacterium]